MTWKDILKMTFDEAQTKATQIMMDKYNPEGRAGVSMDFATIPKYQEEYRKLVQSLYKAKEEEKMVGAITTATPNITRVSYSQRRKKRGKEDKEE